MVAVKLAAKAAELAGGRPTRELWRDAKGIRKSLKQQLQSMAVGRDYCMYCGDGIGSDIDHHEPIARNPARTEQTIKVCGLNRPLLERGRQLAFNQVRYAVRAWWEAHSSADLESVAQALWTLRDQPHADVLHAMLRQAELPGARDIFEVMTS